jgi:hypothetical protein
MPFNAENWLLSRVCEEFPAYTVETAARSLMEDPERRVLAIMELRGYQRTRDAIMAAQKPSEAPTGPLADWVKRVMSARLEEEAGSGG